MRRIAILTAIFLFCACSERAKEGSDSPTSPRSEADNIESKFPPIGADARINPVQAEESDVPDPRYPKASFRQYADKKLDDAEDIAAKSAEIFRDLDKARPYLQRYFELLLDFTIDRVFLCITEEDYTNLSTALKEHDWKTLEQMEKANRFKYLTHGTKVSILAKRGTLSRIRTVTGDEGWITSFALDQSMTPEAARMKPKDRDLKRNSSKLGRAYREVEESLRAERSIPNEPETVYITETAEGKYYHRDNCPLLRDLSLRGTSVVIAKYNGYAPCQICKPPEY